MPAADPRGPGTGGRAVGRLARWADAVDTLTTRVGQGASWLYPLLVAVLVVNVTLRYVFGRGYIELEELQWHLFSAAFLLGLAYTYAADEHVRVDLLRDGFSPRTRAWIELAGSALLLFPFSLLLTGWSFEFFWLSWTLGERSAMPSGLPARWVIKGVLVVSLALLTLQAFGSAARSAAALVGATAAPPGREPPDSERPQ